MVNLNKSSKKKGHRDFEKAKVKVGKVKAGAVNATNTAFTTKRLAIKEQQLSTAQKVAAAVQSSDTPIDGLAALLKPILVQAGHYNANSRRDAYSMIIRRLKEHSIKEVEQVLGDLLIPLSRGMVDEDFSVRSLVLGLTGKLFTDHGANLVAFFDTWVQFMSLAQTHLQEDIRRDACKFLETAIKAVPLLLVNHGGMILASLADANSRLKKPSRSKSKGPSPLEVATSLLECVVKIRNTDSSETGINYAWQPLQQLSLRSCLIRRRPKNASLTNFSILEPDAKKIIIWIGEEMLDDWLEAGPVFAHPKLSHGTSERLAHGRVVKLVKLLEAFFFLAGFDTTFVAINLPATIRSSPLLCDLLLHNTY